MNYDINATDKILKQTINELLTGQTFAECNNSLNDRSHVRHKLRPDMHRIRNTLTLHTS